MARVKIIGAEYGTSFQIKEVWHKLSFKIETEVGPEEDLSEIKEKTWNTVIVEVEKQINSILSEK